MGLLFAILVIAFIILIRKRGKGIDNSNTRKATASELEELILAADKEGGQGSKRVQLYAYEDAHNISEEQHIKVRENLYRRLANAGDADGLLQMGIDADLKKNHSEAERLWIQAAEKGKREAMTYLGVGYSENGDFPTDLKKAYNWFNMAAQMGDSRAMWYLGNAYNYGDGIEKDEAQAMYWWKRGFANGDLNCGFSLADRYNFRIMPDGTPCSDPKAAIEVLEKIMAMKDRDAYASAAKKLGDIFGSAFIYEGIKPNPYTDRHKAAYCYALAYIADDDEYAEENMRKVNYPVSQEEWNTWRGDACELRYRVNL